jgi:hypothetical protein
MPGEPSSKRVLMGHQEGDALAPSKRSAVEELAKFQLLKEKMSVQSDPRLGEKAKKVLGALSEVEILTFNICEKLSSDPKYSQSTADYQELVRFTGEESYIGIAERLAAEIYEIKRGQYLFSHFDAGVTVDGLKASRTEGGGGLFGALAAALGGGSAASGGR